MVKHKDIFDTHRSDKTEKLMLRWKNYNLENKSGNQKTESSKDILMKPELNHNHSKAEIIGKSPMPEVELVQRILSSENLKQSHQVWELTY